MTQPEQRAKWRKWANSWIDRHRPQKQARDRAWQGSRPGYNSWKAMMTRCHHPGAKTYAKYGARGIKVYEPWHKYSTFASQALAGWKPGHHLHRPNPSRDYEPGNIQWVEPSEHARLTNRARWGTPDAWDDFHHDILNIA